MKYYHKLRIFIKKFGRKSLVFIYESGFEDNQDCIYACSKKGKKVYGEQEGKRGKRENLVAGRRKKEKDLRAPIMDHSPIHRKNVIVPLLFRITIVQKDT